MCVETLATPYLDTATTVTATVAGPRRAKNLTPPVEMMRHRNRAWNLIIIHGGPWVGVVIFTNGFGARMSYGIAVLVERD